MTICLFSAPFGSALAQDSEMKDPRKEFLVSLSGSLYPSLKAFDQTGPNQSFEGVVKPGWSLGVSSRVWLGPSARSGLSMDGSMEAIPFAFSYIADYQKQLGIPYDDGRQVWTSRRFWQFQLGMTGYRRFDNGPIDIQCCPGKLEELC
jgi:hypothetical protein